MTPQLPQAQTNPSGPAVPRVSIQPLTRQQVVKPGSPYNTALAALITAVRAESDPEQSIVYSKIRRNNYYYRGKQYLTLVRSSDGATIDYRPVQGSGMTPFSPSDQQNGPRDEMYDNTLPLFRGDVRKWCGVLGVRSPNAKCSPRTVGDDNQIRLSRIGDRAISYLKNSWQADGIQRYLAYSLAVNGTTFGYVQPVSDGVKYGTTEVPRLSVVQVPAGNPYFQCWKCGSDNAVAQVQQLGQCQACGSQLGPEDYREPELVPGVKITSVDRYPNCAVELSIFTPATCKTPYYVRQDGATLERAPWLWNEYLVNRYELIRTYAGSPDPSDQSPDAQFRRELREFLLADRTTDSFGVSTAEVRRTENTLSSPSGMPYERKSLANFGQYFISPGQLEQLPGDQSGNLREQIIANYPKGLHLSYCNGMLMDAKEAALAEHWTVCQPDIGEFVYRDAVFDDYIQGQDVINDSLNLLIQQAEKSTPLTVFDPDVLDPAMLRDKQIMTGEFIEAKKAVGGQLAQGFFRLPAADMNDSLIKFIEFYIQKNRENVGIMPAIYGGGAGDEAVGVARIRRNQSLMQLNIPWNGMRDFWGQTYLNAIRLLARYANGKLVTNRSGTIEIEELDGLEELIQGGIKVECEESMPMTWAQRQEQVEAMLQRAPQSWALLGIANADGTPNVANIEALQEATGMEDWEVPGLAAKERLLDIIHRLLQQNPTDQPPSPPDPMQPPGPPPPPAPPQPSIPIELTMFDPKFAVQVCQLWLQSDKGSEAERGALPGQAPRGFENVLAYTKAWMDAATPPPPPPPPAPPPRVSVSLSGADLAPLGVVPAIQGDFGVQPGTPGALGPPQGAPTAAGSMGPPAPGGSPPGPGPSGPGGPGGPSPTSLGPPDQRQLSAAPPPVGGINGPPPISSNPLMGPAPGGLQ